MYQSSRAISQNLHGRSSSVSSVCCAHHHAIFQASDLAFSKVCEQRSDDLLD